MWKKPTDVIKQLDAVLSKELCVELFQTFFKKNEVDRTNITSWGTDIVGLSSYVLVNDVTGELREKVLTEILKSIPSLVPERSSVMIYRWSRFSYIPKHIDNHVGQAVSIYLNQEYDVNEGGLYVYRHAGEKNWTAIEPRFNTGVYASGKIEHMVTPVTSRRERVSLQIFCKHAD